MIRTVRIRTAREEDLEEVLKIERTVFSEEWPSHLRLTEDHFRSWLENFNEGFLVGELEGKLLGYAMVEILEYDLAHPISTWAEATDDGFIKKSHNPLGDTIYGVSTGVLKNNIRLGKKLMLAAIEKFSKMENIKKGVIVSRVPKYYKFANFMPIEKYVYSRRNNGRALDPLIAFYEECGFKIIRIMPNFIKDPFSLGYGVLMSRGKMGGENGSHGP